MASAGLRALLARATTRLRTPVGARSPTPTPTGNTVWRSLLARVTARYRSTTGVRDGGDAAAQPTAALRSKKKGKEILDTNKISPKTIAKSSPPKALGIGKNKPRVLKEKLEISPVIKDIAPTPNNEIGAVEKFVSSAEHNISLAIRFTKVLNGAGTAFSEFVKALGAFSLGTSLLLYHRDRLVENYEKLKDMFPGASGIPPAAPSSAPPAPSSSSSSAPPAPSSSSSSAPPAASSSQ